MVAMSLSAMMEQFGHLLEEAQSSCVAQWDIQHVEHYAEWCVCLESELALKEQTTVDKLRHDLLDKAQYQIPPVDDLLAAHRVLYKTMLSNPHVSTDVYHYLLQTYRFLSEPNEHVVMEDLALVAQAKAADGVVQQLWQMLDGKGK